MPRNKNTLNCFSPPVMIATMVIEISLAAYTVWRYKLTPASRLIAVMLTALAAFQLCEYFVCTGAVGHAVVWSRLGFVAISLLPPLGLHLMHVLAGKRQGYLTYLAYATMAGFVAFFLTTKNAFSGHQCTGNYVIFQFSHNVTGMYSLYYYSWLLISLGLGRRWANELQAAGKEAVRRLEAIRGLMIGYMVFLVPTAVAITLRPQAGHGIPSVMCGFAVLLALILGFYILPRTGQPRG